MPKRKRTSGKNGQSSGAKKGKVSATEKENKENKLEWTGDDVGVALTFGSGDCAQLGHGDVEKFRERKKPKVVEGMLGMNVVKISSGPLHCAAVTEEGQLYTWGCNDEAALGRTGDEFLPGVVGGALEGEKIVDVTCGDSHTVVLTSKGQVFSWGSYRDSSGVMRNKRTGERASTKEPELVHGLGKHFIVQIASGYNHDMALTDSGKVFYWGDAGVGIRASSRSKMTRFVPREVKIRSPKGAGLPSRIRIGRIFAGGATNFAIEKTTGLVFAWGPNNFGQCGLPNEESKNIDEVGIVRPTPLKLADGSFLRGVVKVVAATHHSVLMAEGGAVYSFGRGDDGRLGLGDESHFRGEQSGQKHRSLPTLLQAFAYDSGKCVLAKGDVIVDISCGENHGLAASKEGKLYTWGDGDLLQNGTGEFEAEWTPRHITSQQITTFPRKVVQVCGGSQHSFILAEDPHNAQPSK